MSHYLYRGILGLLLLGVLLAACIYAYLQHPKFGAMPEGQRLGRIERSLNYANGEFHNLVATPMRTGDSSFLSNVLSMLFDRNDRLTPGVAVPSVKIDLKALDPRQDVVVWLGHSSYFVQLGGRKLLIDPVFSAEAAPIPHLNRAFAGSTPYAASDMPDLDYLLITHDHWDHLDYPSTMALQSKVGYVIAGLGVGADFARWGYPAERILEADWNDTLSPHGDVRIHVLPARHYSGRLLTRNKTLWVGYALETPERRLFFSGDSGYGPHFREIGEKFGGFDLVALDGGQYDRRWANIHMFPEESAQAAADLRTKALLPAHVGRFTIAAHDWDEPFVRIAAASEGKPYRLLTPTIGDVVRLGDETQEFSYWWEAVRAPAAQVSR